MRKYALKFTFMIFLAGVGISYQTFAQNYKYKDLFPMLEAKDYQTGEPGLTKFLSNNPDHPNANFQMAIYYDEFKNDCENALIYYERAQKLIDKKEISKNEKYYQTYIRRDLRTGKYTVKYDDVQFDIEKRIDKCAE